MALARCPSCPLLLTDSLIAIVQLSTPEFTKVFGPAKKDGRGKGQRCNVFGFEDELKVAPKMEGVDKTHPEIDWLKLRSFIVSKT